MAREISAASMECVVRTIVAGTEFTMYPLPSKRGARSGMLQGCSGQEEQVISRDTKDAGPGGETRRPGRGRRGAPSPRPCQGFQTPVMERCGRRGLSVEPARTPGPTPRRGVVDIRLATIPPIRALAAR